MPVSKKSSHSHYPDAQGKLHGTARVGRLLAGLVVLTVVMAGAAYFVQSGLTGRQIDGVKRVLASFDAESAELEKHWSLGEVPAEMVQAEQEHIDDETQQQQSQLSQLEQSAANG
jgi:hypothetical protein